MGCNVYVEENSPADDRLSRLSRFKLLSDVGQWDKKPFMPACQESVDMKKFGCPCEQICIPQTCPSKLIGVTNRWLDGSQPCVVMNSHDLVS